MQNPALRAMGRLDAPAEKHTGSNSLQGRDLAEVEQSAPANYDQERRIRQGAKLNKSFPDPRSMPSYEKWAARGNGDRPSGTLESAAARLELDAAAHRAQSRGLDLPEQERQSLGR